MHSGRENPPVQLKEVLKVALSRHTVVHSRSWFAIKRSETLKMCSVAARAAGWTTRAIRRGGKWLTSRCEAPQRRWKPAHPAGLMRNQGFFTEGLAFRNAIWAPRAKGVVVCGGSEGQASATRSLLLHCRLWPASFVPFVFCHRR